MFRELMKPGRKPHTNKNASRKQYAGMSESAPVLIVTHERERAAEVEAKYRESGIPCRCVASAADAIEYLSQPAAIPLQVLVDLWLPGTQGFELLEWIHEQDFLSSVEVQLMQGLSETCDESALRAARGLAV